MGNYHLFSLRALMETAMTIQAMPLDAVWTATHRLLVLKRLFPVGRRPENRKRFRCCNEQLCPGKGSKFSNPEACASVIQESKGVPVRTFIPAETKATIKLQRIFVKQKAGNRNAGCRRMSMEGAADWKRRRRRAAIHRLARFYLFCAERFLSFRFSPRKNAPIQWAAAEAIRRPASMSLLRMMCQVP